MLRALILCPWMVFTAMAQTGPALSTTEERQVVLEMGKVRQQPREYARWLRTLRHHFEGRLWKLPERVPIRTQEGVAALEELIAVLEHAPSVGPLRWNEGLSQAARQWVLEQGPTGRIGHTGPDGSNLQSRALQQGLHQSLLGEVINYGPETPRWTVLHLLIDDGVPSRGHRNAILNPDFHVAGAAIGPHAAYGEMTVVDLADAFVENP